MEIHATDDLHHAALNAEADASDMQDAARILGVQMVIAKAASEHDLNAAFASAVAQRADALIVHIDGLFQGRVREITGLAVRYRLPVMGGSRQFTEADGLISYGTNTDLMYRQAGMYVARVLKGEKPADLPVMQPTRFELVVNLKTAKAIGLTISESFLVRADEVIE